MGLIDEKTEGSYLNYKILPVNLFPNLETPLTVLKSATGTKEVELYLTLKKTMKKIQSYNCSFAFAIRPVVGIVTRYHNGVSNIKLFFVLFKTITHYKCSDFCTTLYYSNDDLSTAPVEARYDFYCRSPSWNSQSNPIDLKSNR
jgi:hypothetical protein